MGKFFSSDDKRDDPPVAFPATKPEHPPAFGPPNPTAGPSTPTWGCLLLARSDRLRIIGLPQDVVAPIEEAITRVWAPGIQKTGVYEAGGYEFKLAGNPSGRGQGSEAVPARRLICHVLHGLALAGWHLAFSTDLSKKQWDKDTLYLRPGPPRQQYFFAVSFNESDKVRLIDSPKPSVTTAFQAAVSSWPLGIQSVKEKEHGCLQIKLNGRPWFSSDGAEVNYARLLGCSILGAMDGHGFQMVGSVDMSMANGDVGDLDTWFFADK